MTIASWNIAGGHTLIGKTTQALRTNYKKENLEYFIRILRAANADLIALQEAHCSVRGGEPAWMVCMVVRLLYQIEMP